MAIFDIEKDDLLRLSDTLLEELIARLAEAEVSANGYSLAYVRWSGSINASDGRIDVHVQVPVENLSTGFLERPDTIFQAKKHSMGKSAIQKEMSDDGQLVAAIAGQASKGGSYIIVSLSDDCSPTMRNDRLKAMQEALQGDSNSDQIHLDFYDRSKLAQWLRQHPSVLLWVKEKLGQGYSGWKPYGAWSNPPKDIDDTLIADEGVIVTLPQGNKCGIADAIEPLRQLIRTTSKAVRVTGLSGVGKTRIVQALFDESIGANPLDRTSVVYVDTGDSPEPSATAMLERLISEGRTAMLVLDNCPSELHSSLAPKVSGNGVNVRLITIEYDISDGKPQTTEVIHIEAIGPQIAEKLLRRRFPAIGQLNARRIAEFSDGNARVALAIAERVEEGESLGQLSDEQLFSRLFEQRKSSDNDLREHAEILSLVYSFSISSVGDQGNELDILASIAGTTRRKLLRAVSLLSARHVVQQRSHWRAILPHAIANRLAASALSSFPADEIREAFEQSGSQRLLTSFAHRQGLLHDHPAAREIAETWLGPEGLLGKLFELDPRGEQILGYIAPAAPEAVLECIERELSAAGYVIPDTDFRPSRFMILRLLKSLAYESDLFDRCAEVLLRIADDEKENNNHDSARGILEGVFRAYLSGTHASLQQRLVVIRECLQPEADHRHSLGLKMLQTALGSHWQGFGNRDFGARPRDYGFYPNRDELLEWRCEFIDIAMQLGISTDSELKSSARGILANAFSGLWDQEALRSKLLESARLLHQHSSWSEGLHAIRSKNYFDRRRQDGDASQVSIELLELERELEPMDLVARIQAYVFPSCHGYWGGDPEFETDGTEKYEDSRRRLAERATALGAEFSASGRPLQELGERLFGRNDMSLVEAFGRGLAQGALDVRIYWDNLIECLDFVEQETRNYAVLAGFIESVDSAESSVAQELLDQCAEHPVLRQVLVGLHPIKSFDEHDLDRCMSIIEEPNLNLRMYEPVIWMGEFSHLPDSHILDLVWRLLSMPAGAEVVLGALNMRLHRQNEALDTLGLNLRRAGLKAAIQQLAKGRGDVGGYMDSELECVIRSALLFGGNENEKHELIDTIFSLVEANYGDIYGFENAIETIIAFMPKTFLDQVFEGDEDQRRLRLNFAQHGGMNRSPLSKIDVDDLILYCQSRNDSDVWAALAFGVVSWSKDGDDGVATLSERALRFLDASPDPNAVIEVFAECVESSSYSGSRGNIMRRRADAIGLLVKHERTDIAVAARTIYEKLLLKIEKTRIQEEKWNEKNEQRFE